MSLPLRRRWMHVSNSSALELMKDKFESLLDELFRLLVGALEHASYAPLFPHIFGMLPITMHLPPPIHSLLCI